jgi:hypothetical protein
MTLDLDIVHRRDAGNIERLLHALDELGACYRHRRDLRPSESHLLTTGHQLLWTSAGPLDVLVAIEDGMSYEDSLECSIELEFGLACPVKVLSLRTYVELRERMTREKDRARLPELRAVLARMEGGRGEE